MYMSKEAVFVRHIENHLRHEHKDEPVKCKICGKTITEIYVIEGQWIE